MKKRNLFPAVLICFVYILVLSGCKKDDSDNKLSDQDIHINEFIWEGLHDYYLWVDKVPNLSTSQFSTKNELISFLDGYSDHEKLFYDLLYEYESVDKWSWIVDDYEELEKMFQGISLSMGYEFQFGRFSGTDNLFGIVIYVLKGSPAETAGIKRGDIFIQVNGQDITVSNYQNLLFSNNTYNMSFGVISGNNIISNGKTVSLTAVEIQENPIFLDTVYTINSKKIGYLVYNMFNSEFDIELNNVFKNFKEDNIDELILDLRYNSGGSINTSVYLASMIYSTNTNKVFINCEYNDLYGNFLDETYGEEASVYKFSDHIFKTDVNPEVPLNSLGLDRLFVITTENTASASELVINGLKPYINVITIGSKTAGKYVGSTTIKDYDEKGNINPDHKWALQPIVLKLANSEGKSDYFGGLPPSIIINEDITSMSEFGEIDEPLLAKAISYIDKGYIEEGMKSAAISKSSSLDFVSYGISKEYKPFSKEMYINNMRQGKKAN